METRITHDELVAMREHAEANVHYGDGEDPRNVLRLLDLVQEYEQAISWDTTCLNCSNLIDKNYEQYVKLEQVIALRDKWRTTDEPDPWYWSDVADELDEALEVTDG